MTSSASNATPPSAYIRHLPLGIGALLLLVISVLAYSSMGIWLIGCELGVLACLGYALYLRQPDGEKQPEINALAMPTEFAIEKTTDIYACLPDLIWLIDHGTREVTPLNKTSASHHPSTQSNQVKLSALLPARIARQYLETLIAVQSKQEAQQFEYQLTGEDGKNRVFEARLQPRSVKNCVALIRDITHLKDTEEALFNQQLFVHQIIDSSPNLIYVRDKHGRFLLVNRATQATLGHELLMQSHMGIGEDEQPFTTGDKEVLEDGATIRIVDHWTLPNGRTHWFDITKQPLVREGDIYILSIAIDISHVKAAEAALAVTDPLAGDVADALPVAFMLVRDGIVEFANLLACEKLNAPPSAMLGRPLSAFTPNAQALLDGSASEFACTRSGKRWPCVCRTISQGERSAQLLILKEFLPEVRLSA
ncbi:Virulence sensor protein BvgS [Andreprevotia sp. IGB-42]|uniref:PAS domain-containing protein n=1 Tax=Andreprevotia sp. IGB-42 TaxID=2497473 RepID=UPI00135751AA|nr:PAS domain-containing protein [Andreprevotia sp. IGB-42]KAF0814276.1 Virulence sensor protein BvgS [Andreprevotia sp. IGB-42]